MNILMISYWDFQKHGMQVIKKTPIFFADKGHEVVFIVHSEMTAKPSLQVNLHENINIFRCVFPFQWLKKNRALWRMWILLYFVAYTVKIVARVRRSGWKPDVIYAAEADAVIVGNILKRYFKIPFVSRFYGVSRIKTHIDFGKRKIKSAVLTNLASRIALRQKADLCVVTDDGSDGKRIIKIFNKYNKNILFIKNGLGDIKVDIEKIKSMRRNFKLEKHDYIMLTLCRLDPMKRVDRAIRVLSTLTKNFHNLKLMVVGHGALRSELERLAESLGVGDRCLFVGAINHDEIYNYYAISDCFLSMYDITNVGNPLLEALWAGKPIVTLDTGNTKSVIVDGVNGWLCPAVEKEDTIACVANAVSAMIKDSALQETISLNATLYAKKNFIRWDQRLAIELEAIERLLQETQRHAM